MADICRLVYYFGDVEPNYLRFSGWVIEGEKQDVIDQINAVNPAGEGSPAGISPTIVGWETRSYEEAE